MPARVMFLVAIRTQCRRERLVVVAATNAEALEKARRERPDAPRDAFAPWSAVRRHLAAKRPLYRAHVAEIPVARATDGARPGWGASRIFMRVPTERAMGSNFHAHRLNENGQARE